MGEDTGRVSLSFRFATVALAAVVVLAVATRWLTDNSTVVWMLRVALSSMSIAFVPGAMSVLAWHPRRSFDLLEWAGIGLAVSFSIIELLTIAALVVHWSPAVSVAILVVFSIGTAWRAWQREGALHLGIGQLAICVALVVLAVYLYAIGSPYDNVEDRIHIAIVERLANLSAPSFRNIYFSPGVVYTYPFPGTHYLVALVARLGNMPGIFAYAKLRPFWGVASIVLLYGCVSLAFESRRIAVASTLIVAGLVANGAFATAGQYWGQMAPFSHASDVAMGVLLPALLLVTFEVFRSGDRREYWFSMAATMMLTLMLVVVHTREVVQFVVYIAAFALVVALARGPRPLLAKAAGVLVGTAVVLLLYRAWNASAVPLIDALVEAHRRDLRDIWHGTTWAELFGQPYPLLRNYMPAFEPMLYGWNPLVLLLTPLILFAVRGRKLAWLIAASIGCYALIIRFPVFGITYIYTTYFEILYSPVRNFIFFIYMLTGVGLYVLAAQLSRLAYVWLVPLALAAGLGIVQAIRHLAPAASQRIDVMFVPVLVGYAAFFAVLIWTGGRERADAAVFNPRPRWIVALLIVLAVPIYVTRVADAAVVGWPWQDRTATPSALMASMPCRNNIDCPPPPELIRLAHKGIPADALFAVDFHEQYQPALFMPQQMVVWTGGTDSLLEPETIFPRYFQYLKSARDAAADQPLFNVSESRDRRAAFLRDLSVTHVLLDPVLYKTMKPVFDADTDLLAPRYDDGQWALYEVKRR